MVFPKTRFLIIASIIVLAMILSNCGGNGGGEQSQQSQPASGSAQKTSMAKGDAVKGKDAYMQSCTACHGPDAKGIKGLGKDLTNNEYIKTHTDEELLKYVLVGRMPDDPLNTTGVAMPPKGGNPALTEAQIVDIIAYMRTLQN